MKAKGGRIISIEFNAGDWGEIPVHRPATVTGSEILGRGKIRRLIASSHSGRTEAAVKLAPVH